MPHFEGRDCMERMKRPFSRKYEIVILVSVFIISFSVLTFEITLTRIFSVTYSYHYSFLAVSLALFGLGLGGVFAHKIFTKTSVGDIFTNLALTSLLFSLLISLFTIVRVPSTSVDFTTDAGLMFFPFFVAGIFLATIYKFFAIHGNVIYFLDLVGASVGSLAIVIFLGHCNAINLVLLIGVISSVGSMLLAFASKRKKIVFITITVFLLLASLTQSTHNYLLEVPIGSNQNKELYDLLSDPSLGVNIIESRWSAFGRTDLVEYAKDPHMKSIFVDGGAGTDMYHFNGNFSDANSKVNTLKYSTAYFPFYFANKDEVLIIGPGGGKDVLMALMAGVDHITAVEVNPEMVNLVRDYSDFNGGIYTKYDNVHVFIDEGRSFLKRTLRKYDVIMLNIPITKTAQGTSGYSLAENYLFTTGSFRDYLTHLKDQGYLVIVAHHRLEVYKLTTIALKVLGDEGVSVRESMRRVVITEMHYSHFPVFILKKSAFTQGEIKEMHAKSNELGFTPVYFPYINSETLDPVLTGLANEEIALDTVISHLREHYGYDIRPPTDDRPFFYKFIKGLPPTLSQLLIGSFILCAFMLILYFGTWGRRLYSARKGKKRKLHSLARRRRHRRHRFSVFIPYYFSSLGLGFMLIEVSLIQKFILFVGHPTFAISVLLFSLLLSSGVGSLYSRRWRRKPWRPALRASLIIGIIVILYIIILPSILNLFLSYNSTIRFIISIAILFPLGLFMGIPFPSGMVALEKESHGNIAWMWGLNGIYSLLGSVLAIAIAMSLGFNAAFLFGGLIYLTIFAIGHVKPKDTSTLIPYKLVR